MHHQSNRKFNLFPILPASPIKHLEDVAVCGKQAKVLNVDSETESQLFESGSLAELLFLLSDG